MLTNFLRKFDFMFVLMLLLICLLLPQSGHSSNLVGFSIPNVETSVLFDLESKTPNSAITSKLLRISVFNLRVGYLDDGSVLGGLTFDLKELEKLGSQVKYAWSGMLDVSLGMYASYDWKITQKMKYGIIATLLQINFQ